MKKRTFPALFLACLLLLAAPVLAAPEGEAPTGPQPQMVVDTRNFDMGDITPGTIVQHEFVLQNRGEAALELVEVRPSCGCTVAAYDKTIAPGAEGKVLMKVRVYREWAGQDISKSVWLISNDPANPQSTLTLSGRILPHGTDGNKPPLNTK